MKLLVFLRSVRYEIATSLTTYHEAASNKTAERLRDTCEKRQQEVLYECDYLHYKY
jgi:hypothetical protein